MPRKPRPLTKAQVKDAADRAEGLVPPEPTIGRPTEYQPGFAKQAEKLCQHGLTDAEIGEFFGVSRTTITNWKGKHPEFIAALKSGKAQSDDRVERSLYQRAVGYSYETEKVFQYQGEVVRAQTIEHVPPDTTACIFWLKNRRQDAWRDVHRHEHGGVGEFDKLSDAELAQELRRQAAEAGLDEPAGGTQH